MEGCLPDADDRDAGPESPRLRLGVTPRRQGPRGPWTCTLPSTWAATAGVLVQKSDMQLPANPSDWREILYELKHLAYSREAGELPHKLQVEMVMTLRPTPASYREPLNTARVNTAETGCAKHAHH